MEFRKKVALTVQDHLDFNLHALRKLLTILLLLFLLVPLLTLSISEDGNILLTLAVSIIITAAAVIFIFLRTKAAARKNIERDFNTSRLVRAENEIIINDSGLSSSGEFVSLKVGWEDIYRAEESISAFCFYILKMQAVVIPKRLISSEEDSVIRTLITKYIAPNKYRFLKQR
jgi:hypothetical protein